MQKNRFLLISILVMFNHIAYGCGVLNGTWNSSLGTLKVCQGQLAEPTDIWKIHSLLCDKDKIQVISSNGARVVITSYPNMYKNIGDAMTLYNGDETLALYYQGNDCNES